MLKVPLQYNNDVNSLPDEKQPLNQGPSVSTGSAPTFKKGRKVRMERNFRKKVLKTSAPTGGGES